jgi:hypothetical protein
LFYIPTKCSEQVDKHHFSHKNKIKRKKQKIRSLNTSYCLLFTTLIIKGLFLRLFFFFLLNKIEGGGGGGSAVTVYAEHTQGDTNEGGGGSAVTVYALCRLSTHRATPK